MVGSLHIYFLLCIVAYIAANPMLDMIPGLDHLSAGFDASKMVDGVKLAKARVYPSLI
jgi:hypothetical protein